MSVLVGPARAPRARTRRRRSAAARRRRPPVRPSCARAGALGRRRGARRGAPCRTGTPGSGSRRQCEACDRGRAAWGCVCYRPVEPVFDAVRGVLYPFMHARCAVDDRRARAHPGDRAGDPRVEPHLVSRPAALGYLATKRGRRTRFLAKDELFEKRGLGAAFRAMHQIPVSRGTADAAGSLVAAEDALALGRVRRRVPRGHDLAGPRADGRQVRHRPARRGHRARRSSRSGCGVCTGCMFKGRKPRWRAGSRRSSSRRPAHDRRRRGRRGRPTGSWRRSASRSPAPVPGTRSSRAPRRATGGSARPEAARPPELPVTRVKVAVIGAGSWGTAVGAIAAVNADAVLWASRSRRRRARPRRAREPGLPRRHRAAGVAATRPRICSRRVRRGCRGDGRAVARLPRRARRPRRRRSPTTCRSSACRRASSRARCCA